MLLLGFSLDTATLPTASRNFVQLGILNAHITEHPESKIELLNNVSKIVKRNLTETQYDNLINNIKEYQNDSTLVGRIYGLLRGTTFLIVIATIVLLWTADKALGFLETLIPQAVKNLFTALIEVIARFFQLVPGSFELLVDVLLYCVIVDTFVIKDTDGRIVFGTLMFLGFFFAMVIYRNQPIQDEKPILTLMMFAVMPLAYYHQSTFLGFVTVTLFYYLLEWTVICAQCCYILGFTSEFLAHRCISASFILILGFALCRIFNIYPQVFYPFTIGVFVYGNVVYFTALLIMSYDKHGKPSMNYHALMIASLLFCLLVGGVAGLHGMFYTGAVFAVLYVLEWVIMYVHLLTDQTAVVMFMCAASVLMGCNYLNNNPEFVVTILHS
jgi:hypothetical protein